MNALAGLREALGHMGLYRFNGQTLVEQELESYQAGFALLEERFAHLWQNAFLQSCSLPRLEQWEQLLGVSGAEALEQDRRKVLLAKLAITPADHHLKGIERCMQAAGLEVTVEENPPMGEIWLKAGTVIGDFYSMEQLRKNASLLLPAHLGVVFDVGLLTWAIWEAKEMTFALWNEKDFTWERFDYNGEKL